MELVSLLWGLAQIVGTGALTKLGENIFDEASPKVRELVGVIQRKLPQTKTAKAIAAGEELDYQQTFIDVEPIEQDPEVLKLADEVRSLIAKNQALQAKLDAEVAKVRAKNLQVNREKSYGNIQVNDKVEAKFFSGNHTHNYYGTNPDWLKTTEQEPSKTTPHNLLPQNLQLQINILPRQQAFDPLSRISNQTFKFHLKQTNPSGNDNSITEEYFVTGKVIQSQVKYISDSTVEYILKFRWDYKRKKIKWLSIPIAEEDRGDYGIYTFTVTGKSVNRIKIEEVKREAFDKDESFTKPLDINHKSARYGFQGLYEDVVLQLGLFA